MTESSIDGLKAKLSYVTHDTRRVLEIIGTTDIRLYWMVRLMEAIYNYGPGITTGIIKDSIKKNSYSEPFEWVKMSLPMIGRKKQLHHAEFTDRAIMNLFRLDQEIITADYSVRLEVLATVLGKLTETDMDHIIGTNDPCGVNLLLLKLEDFVGNQERQRRDNVPMKPYEMQEIQKPDEASKQLLRDTIKDLKALEDT
jgi:hypothetical protein